MEYILGIDLGTTNSVVSVIQDGKAVVLKDEAGEAILPSVVGLDQNGELLVGHPARNQAILAPHRTVKSIKRLMGQDTQVALGERKYTPQEISAIILRTLKERAARAIGQEVRKAVITVPAFFSERQREATREAGELAGLEVVRIINEPTAASLTYEPPTQRREKLLVYDLGGGTFDVSLVQIEQGVVEVLASHGDTHLGGDDFDQLLLNDLCEQFHEQQGVDLREIPVAKSRLLHAVEEAKKRLSSEAFVRVTEEFIAEKDGLPLHVNVEIDRRDYEALIQTLLVKTLRSVDAALADARLTPDQIDKVILVGGSSRTPLVQRLLLEQLGKDPHLEVDPDLCVSLGAAVQGGMIAGIDVGPVLVDITPHTLGVQVVDRTDEDESEFCFSPIIRRNTPLPAVRSEIYYTGYEGQKAAEIAVFQGEHPDVRHNQPVGKFLLEELDENASEPSEILVRFELNLDGILTVTAVERATSKQKQLTIDNAITRFQAKNRAEARAKLAAIFADSTDLSQVGGVNTEWVPSSPTTELPWVAEVRELISKARKLAADAASEDVEEIDRLSRELESAIASGSDGADVRQNQAALEDLLFYLNDA